MPKGKWLARGFGKLGFRSVHPTGFYACLNMLLITRLATAGLLAIAGWKPAARTGREPMFLVFERHSVDLPLPPRKFLCQPRAGARENLFRRGFWG